MGEVKERKERKIKIKEDFKLINDRDSKATQSILRIERERKGIVSRITIFMENALSLNPKVLEAHR